MPAQAAFDHAVIRVVPHVAREEFVNVGVIVFCAARRFLGCEVALDAARVLALAPDADIEGIHRQLEALRAVCAGAPDAGPIAALPPSERFHWLVAPRSTVVQTSPVHGGLCDDPELALRNLFEVMVRDRHAAAAGAIGSAGSNGSA